MRLQAQKQPFGLPYLADEQRRTNGWQPDGMGAIRRVLLSVCRQLLPRMCDGDSISRCNSPSSPLTIMTTLRYYRRANPPSSEHAALVWFQTQSPSARPQKCRRDGDHISAYIERHKRARDCVRACPPIFTICRRWTRTFQRNKSVGLLLVRIWLKKKALHFQVLG
jgi:hypothetical protein